MFTFKRKNRRKPPKPKIKRQKSVASGSREKIFKVPKLSAKAPKSKRPMPPEPPKLKSRPKTAPKTSKPRAVKKIKRPKTRQSSFSLALDWSSLMQGFMLAGVSFLVLLALPDFRGLWEPWEVSWAQAAREMWLSGHWYHPTLNGWAFEARTPLAYWPIMGSYELFGVSELSARLPGILWAALIVLAVHQVTTGLHSRQAGIMAGLATLFSFTLLAASRVCLVDLGLVFALILSLGGLWSVYLSGQGPALRFWLGCALAFALGGAGALVLPVVCALAIGLLTRSLSWWRGLVCWPGIALFLLITQGALFLVGLNNPSYWEYYLLNHIQSEAYYQTPLYLVAGAFPWLCLLPWAWWVGRNQKEYYRGSGTLPLVWMVLAWLLAPALHLGSLALAVLIWVGCAVWLGPALATLPELGMRSDPPQSLRNSLVCLSLVLFGAAVGYTLSPWLIDGITYKDLGLSLLLVPTLAAGLSFVVFMRRSRTYAGFTAPMVVIMAMAVSLALALPSLDRENSLEDLSRVLRGELKNEDLVVSYGHYWPGLNYYGNRQITLTATKPHQVRRNLRVPAPGGPRHISKSVFLGHVKSDTNRVLAVARTRDFEALVRELSGTPGLLLFDWARRGDWVLFSNRPL